MFRLLSTCRLYYESRYDAHFMDRVRSELSGLLEYICVRIMEGVRVHAEEGNNLTDTPEAAGGTEGLLVD